MKIMMKKILTKKSKGFTIWELLIIIAIIGFFVGMAISSPRSGRRRDSDNECFRNLSLLQTSVDNYNMDNSTMIDNLDSNVIKLLIEKKYLKEEPGHPKVECEYLGKNLSNDGVVYCKYHGSLGFNLETGRGISPGSEYLNKLKGERLEKKFFEFLPYVIGFGVAVVFLFQFILKRKTNKK